MEERKDGDEEEAREDFLVDPDDGVGEEEVAEGASLPSRNLFFKAAALDWSSALVVGPAEVSL